MSSHVETVLETDADIRWREWQARGVASDLRTKASMRRFLLGGAAAVAVWMILQLV